MDMSLKANQSQADIERCKEINRASSRRYYARNADKRLEARRGKCKRCGGPKPPGIRRHFCDSCGPKPKPEYSKTYYERHPEKVASASLRWRRANPVFQLVSGAKMRAKKKGIPFEISAADIAIPEICPVLGIKLHRGAGRTDCSPSIDRINNSLGYVRGNVLVISWRANRLKGDGTLAELRAIADFYAALEDRNGASLNSGDALRSL